MKCMRFDLRRTLPRYVDGELNARTVERVEHHLLDCNSCRARIARLRDGQRLARQLPRRQPPSDGWEAIASALETTLSPTTPVRADERATWQQVLTSPYFAIIIFAVALMTLSAALLWQRQKPQPLVAADPVGAFDTSHFRPVLISEIDKNTAPHVVAEGYVKEVKIDENDGDYLFKLVEDVRQAEPFIICEIITPINIKPPAVGSRVRVYGVSRFDAEEGRRWHEVHPVLNIETVKH